MSIVWDNRAKRGRTRNLPSVFDPGSASSRNFRVCGSLSRLSFSRTVLKCRPLVGDVGLAVGLRRRPVAEGVLVMPVAAGEVQPFGRTGQQSVIGHPVRILVRVWRITDFPRISNSPHTRNWQVVRRPSRPKPSIGDCQGARPSASRRQRSSYAATAALTTWRRASSSDAIGGAEGVSASGTVRRRGRRRRRARSNAKRRDSGSGVGEEAQSRIS